MYTVKFHLRASSFHFDLVNAIETKLVFYVFINLGKHVNNDKKIDTFFIFRVRGKRSRLPLTNIEIDAST